MAGLLSLSIRQKIILGFTFPLLLIGLFSGYIYSSIQSSLNTADWVRHTQEVITKAYLLEKHMIDMETGQRGFLITGKEHFLEPYIASRQTWEQDIKAMKLLVSDTPVQVNRIEELKKVADKWIETIAKAEIEHRRKIKGQTVTLAELEGLKENEQGKIIMDEIRQRIFEFIQVEEQLMEVRTQEATQSAQLSLLISAIGLPLLAFLGAAIAIYVLFKAILNPLKRLLRATEEIANGDLTITMISDSHDEIGQLTSSFNKMTKSLKDSSEATQIANQALEVKAQELEAASKHKSQFLANMSHEIRTPLNGVLGMISLILRNEISDKARRYAHLAMESADSLLVVINDILDFSKIEAGKLEIESVEFDIQLLFRDFGLATGHRAQEKHLEFVMDLVDLPPIKVNGDPGRIRQVLNNLANNAIKFTEEGEIVVSASIEYMENNKLNLKCSVSDTGIGISPDKLPTLFQEFTQEDASTTREYGGTGLGLTIVKQLCQLMGGDVCAGSLKGKGSDFSFTIELEKSSSKDQIVEDFQLQPTNILIIEPNQTNRKLVQKQLTAWQTQAIAFSNIGRACDYLSEDKEVISALIIDKQVILDCDAATKQTLKELCSTQNINLVIMSSISQIGEMQQYFPASKVHYLAKPVTPSDLFDVLNESIYNQPSKQNKSSHLTTITRDSAIGSSNKKIQTSSDISNRILLVDDNSFNQEVALGFMQDMDLNVGVASNGKEAIEQLIFAAKSEPYNLILMDCQMPEMDGYEATRMIRSGKAEVPDTNIPIIAMTANAMRGDKEKCIAAGMNDYLSKPISFNSLSDKLSEWISLENDSGNTVSTTEQVTNNTEQWNEIEFLNRLKNKRDRAEKLVQLFLDSTPDVIQELKACTSNEDFSPLAHKLKGSFVNLSAGILTEITANLELHASSMSETEITTTLNLIEQEFEKLTHRLIQWKDQSTQQT